MSQDLFKYKSTFDSFVRLNPTHLSSHAYTSIFIWQDFFEFHIKNIDKHLCVFAKDIAGTFLYLPPLAKKIAPSVVEECFEIMRADNKGSSLTRVENVGEDEWKSFDKKTFRIERETQEFIYKRQAIVDLKGNAYKSKRSDYNHFVKNNTFEFLPFKENMAAECLALYKDWAKARRAKYSDELYRFMLEDNLKVHQLAIKFYKKLGLIGRVVKVKNKIKAYTFGFPIDKDYFCVLFEIADTTLKGLPTFIFREFSADKSLQRYSFINVMDDFYLKNIEQTKTSFRPAALLPVYTVGVK